MKKPFLRTTSDYSLLKDESGKYLPVISQHFSRFIMNNDKYFARSLSRVEDGRAELQKMLQDVRKVIFSKDELINWFHKVRQDAKMETDIIFIKYEADLGTDENKIDFERCGYLAGIHSEADRYLNIMVAIEPLDEGKPHYAILDRLDSLDETFVRTDSIPGYYAFQNDKRIAKQHFEIKNLDDYWADYLSLKDKHEVREGFGNLKYLLSYYHSEFRWELIKVRPREEIKQFLNFHLKRFTGDPIDFINHIEFRIMPELDGVAGSNYPIYRLIIKEWLKEKHTGLNKAGEIYLLESVASVSATFLDNVYTYRDFKDENKYNTLICSFLNQRFSTKSWTIKDQSLGGSSNSESKANRAGMAFRDLTVVDDKNHHISAIECFRLHYVPTQNESDSEIAEHLTKIFRNEPIGLSPLFIIVYCETKSFPQTWEKYLNYITNIDFSNYKLIESIKQVLPNPESANIKIAKAVHIRETNEITVYHIFINLFPGGQ